MSEDTLTRGDIEVGIEHARTALANWEAKLAALQPEVPNMFLVAGGETIEVKNGGVSTILIGKYTIQKVHAERLADSVLEAAGVESVESKLKNVGEPDKIQKGEGGYTGEGMKWGEVFVELDAKIAADAIAQVKQFAKEETKKKVKIKWEEENKAMSLSADNIFKDMANLPYYFDYETDYYGFPFPIVRSKHIHALPNDTLPSRYEVFNDEEGHLCVEVPVGHDKLAFDDWSFEEMASIMDKYLSK